MPKKTTKPTKTLTPPKTKAKKPTGLLGRLKALRTDTKIALGLLLAALIVGVAWHEIHLEVRFQNQKSQYAQLEDNMKETIKNVEGKIGAVYEITNDQGCAYSSYTVYQRGPLSCSNSYDYSYQIQSSQEGKELTLQQVDILRQAPAKDFTYEPHLDKLDKGLEVDFNKEQGFGCKFIYQLVSAQTYNENLHRDGRKDATSLYVAEYNYSCGGLPVKPVYKLEKQP